MFSSVISESARLGDLLCQRTSPAFVLQFQNLVSRGIDHHLASIHQRGHSHIEQDVSRQRYRRAAGSMRQRVQGVKMIGSTDARHQQEREARACVQKPSQG
jgi:hypothetical protein